MFEDACYNLSGRFQSSRYGFDGVVRGTINLNTGAFEASIGRKGYVAFEGGHNKSDSFEDISGQVPEEVLDQVRINAFLDALDIEEEWNETGECPSVDVDDSIYGLISPYIR